MASRNRTNIFSLIRLNKTSIKLIIKEKGIIHITLWVSLYDQLNKNYDTIKNLVSKVKELQEEELKNIFYKGIDDIRETLIKEYTSSIKQKLQHSKDLINNIRVIFDNNQFSINIEKGILFQLNNLIRQLHSNQIHYDKEIKVIEKKKKELNVYLPDDVEPIIENKEFQKTKVKSKPEKEVLENEIFIKERDKQLDSVIESLKEILQMFDEFNSILVQQGDLLNRIDYNIDKTNENVKEAVISLKVAEEADQCSKLTCGLIILIVLTIFLILLVIIKLLIKFIR